MMIFSDGQQKILGAFGHLLVTGGPGSGKTTISILKAAKIIEQGISPGQKILFLSFARATVSRVAEAIEHEMKISSEQRKLIDVETYHSFFWSLLKAHGYLIGLPRRLSILTPQHEAIALAETRGLFSKPKLTEVDKSQREQNEYIERKRLAKEEGRVCFDLFAPYVGKILTGSKRIRRLVTNKYPVIILDEFQDTNDDQWRIVEALGKFGKLIALADPEQRIFEWIGANPERLNHFRYSIRPTEVNLRTDNYRNAGTEISQFGNDILNQKFRQKEYKGIKIMHFTPYEGLAKKELLQAVYAARRRLADAEPANWSLAILVPTKKMTRIVSDGLRHPPTGMSAVRHSAIIDLNGAILAAEVIAHAMQAKDGDHLKQFVKLLCNYFRGKGGDRITKKALQTAALVEKSHYEWQKCQKAGTSLRKNSVFNRTIKVYTQICDKKLVGNPDNDWLAVRQLMEKGDCLHLKDIALDARNIRILDRGTQLRADLSEDWRESSEYRNSLSITKHAFIQEHFSGNSKPESGVIIMNIDKSKGKQFDEVIMFEGWPRIDKGKIKHNGDRFVRNNLPESINEQTKQKFRVGITRGRHRVSILTPSNNPCVLLPS